jgi:hypothetical protein
MGCAKGCACAGASANTAAAANASRAHRVLNVMFCPSVVLKEHGAEIGGEKQVRRIAKICEA